jgi:hypothetical protein
MPHQSPICATTTLADTLAALPPGDYLLLPAAAASASSTPLPAQFAPLLAGLPSGHYVLFSSEITWEELAEI